MARFLQQLPNQRKSCKKESAARLWEVPNGRLGLERRKQFGERTPYLEKKKESVGATRGNGDCPGWREYRYLP